MSDYQFFKYREINKFTLDSLIKGNLYFASPSKLNDPFDCRVDIKKSMINASDKLKENESQRLLALSQQNLLYESIHRDIEKIGICSFSLNTLNVVMWSHYANDHKGITILYGFPEKYLDDGDKFIGITNITYEEDTLTNYFIDLASKSEKEFKEYVIDIAKVLISSKSPGWSYEEEARIITHTPGLLNINKEYIKQITFGLNTSDEDKKLIKEIINSYKHKVELCEIVRSESDYGIDIKEI